MQCAVCGANARKDRPPIQAPPPLAGKPACDWCGLRLDQLVKGTLSRGDLDQLLVYVRKLEDPDLAQQIDALWKEPGAAKAEADARAAVEDAALKAAVAAMPVTSGFDFEGAHIRAYLGFVSAEVVLGMGLFRGIGSDFADLFGTEAQGLGRKLADAKAAAFDKLRRDVLAMGGNAIIGIDLDYTMFGSSLVGVIASGTAVVTEWEGPGA